MMLRSPAGNTSMSRPTLCKHCRLELPLDPMGLCLDCGSLRWVVLLHGPTCSAARGLHRGSALESLHVLHLPLGPTNTLPGGRARMMVMEYRLEVGFHHTHPMDAEWDAGDLDVGAVSGRTGGSHGQARRRLLEGGPAIGWRGAFSEAEMGG